VSPSARTAKNKEAWELLSVTMIWMGVSTS